MQDSTVISTADMTAEEFRLHKRKWHRGEDAALSRAAHDYRHSRFTDSRLAYNHTHLQQIVYEND
jgi:hypothetical protein